LRGDHAQTKGCDVIPLNRIMIQAPENLEAPG
jgi:hypothetical protein